MTLQGKKPRLREGRRNKEERSEALSENLLLQSLRLVTVEHEIVCNWLYDRRVLVHERSCIIYYLLFMGHYGAGGGAR